MSASSAWYKESVFLLAVVVITAVAAYVGLRFLPAAVKNPPRGVDDIPVAWEVAFKDKVKKFVADDAKVVKNEQLADAIETIRHRLVSHVEPNPYDIEVILVESPVVNAVTLPGGLIVVFTSLVRLTDSPEELAAVLAHEMGHVVRRDPLRRLIRQIGVSAVFSMLKGGESSVLLEDVIRQMIDVKYTRDQEREADTFAFDLLARSNINPVHFAAFMEKLRGRDDGGEGGLVKYLRTHPETAERIARAREAGERFDKKQRPFGLDWGRVKSLLPSVFSPRV